MCCSEHAERAPDIFLSSMFFNGNVPVGLDLRHLLVPLTDPRVVCQDFIDYCLGIEPQRFQILLPNFGNNPRPVPLSALCRANGSSCHMNLIGGATIRGNWSSTVPCSQRCP